MLDGAAADRTALHAMADALVHRGPDGFGDYVDGALGLAHRRLSIIDLETGDQPLGGEDSVVLIANGEIYNDLELRAAMADTRFATASDCESPLQLYRQRGMDYIDQLRGMYAIAIYDGGRKRLCISRDPFGIKPLYYVQTARYFAFASEPQALIAAGLASTTLAPRTRAELLQLKFTTGRKTIYADIERLLPGESLTIGQDASVTRAQRPALPPRRRRKADLETLDREMDAVLADTVFHHVRSDVPLGLFLSGGIDSGVLATVMSRLTSQPILALTVGFPGTAARDETEAARVVADAVGAEHHVIEMRPDDLWSLAPKIAAALDDPTTDGAALPMYVMGQAAAAAGRKVMLSGVGADELFGGYSRYRKAVWMGPLARSRSKPVFRGVGGDAASLAHWRDDLAKVAAAEAGGGRSQMQRLQAIDCAEWLPNDVLLMLDRCLMAHGVEGRTPFVDPAVAEFAFNLDDRIKVRGKFGKWILRRWLARNLPQAGAFARKSGFVPPMGEWIATASPATVDLISRQPGVAEALGSDMAKGVLQESARHAQAAWSLLFYALWHSHHVLGVPADGGVDDVLAAALQHA